MSKRMMRRIDTITGYGRWLGLVAVSAMALLFFPNDLKIGSAVFVSIIVVMAVLYAIPLFLLYLRAFPDFAAITFLILDSVFAIAMLFVAGPSTLFYAFIPAVGFGMRFDWAIGLIDAVVLIAGNAVAGLARAAFRDVASVLLSLTGGSIALLAVSVLSGVLAEGIKREPPLNAGEIRAREKELQSLRAAADRARAIYEMAGTLSATLNRDRILDAVLEISAVGFDELDDQGTRFRERPASAVFLYGTDGLYVASSRSVSYAEMDLVIPGQQGVLHKVLTGGEPTVAGSLGADPELSQFADFRQCRSALCVPLRAGFECYGAALFASSRPNAFGEGHVELLSAVCNQAAVALTNAHLYQDLLREKERILEVEEAARSKLARDLHDGPTQSISAIAMRLNFVRLLLGRDPQKVKDELFKLENLARRTTKEIRTMLFTLRPVVLETQGLRAAVEQLADKFREMDDLPIRLEIEDLEGKLDTSTQAVAWFITEECLNNVKKHADARRVEVRMYLRDEHFVVEIQDDGKGFDVDAVMADYDQRGSLGLLNLQERADLVNGRTTIKSAPGEGTQVTLVVPLSREAV